MRSRNWIYFSVTDDQDNGTIIDSSGAGVLNLGEVGDSGLGVSAEPAACPATAIRTWSRSRDLAEVLRSSPDAPIAHGHRYLERNGHPRGVLEDRALPADYTDRYQNAVFPTATAMVSAASDP
jgi:hypothetical protein